MPLKPIVGEELEGTATALVLASVGGHMNVERFAGEIDVGTEVAPEVVQGELGMAACEVFYKCGGGSEFLRADAAAEGAAGMKFGFAGAENSFSLCRFIVGRGFEVSF